MNGNAKVKTKTPLDLDQEIIRQLEFEKDLFRIVNSIKFSNYKNDFQQKLDAYIAELKQSKSVFGFADKTSNINEMPTEQHKKAFRRKCNQSIQKSIAKTIKINQPKSKTHGKED